MSSALPGGIARRALEAVATFAASSRPYLVGGAVRDLLLGRELKDLDISLEGDCEGVGRRLAGALGGTFFFLKEEDSTARVVAGSGGQKVHIDITCRRGSLARDLRARDFTVNAMAVDAARLLSLPSWAPEDVAGIVEDPCGGLGDLARKVLRVPEPSSFSNDPVRVLRALRLCASLGFSMAEDTERLLRLAVPRLLGAAPERIRDELMQILDRPDAARWITEADRLGIVRFVLPCLDALHDVDQNYYHHLGAWEHTIEAVDKLNEVVEIRLADRELCELVVQHLRRSETALYSHAAVVRLAVLLHDVGKPSTRSVDPDGRIRFFGHDGEGVPIADGVCRHLRLSREEAGAVTAVVRFHMRPNHMMRAVERGAPIARAILRFFLDTGRRAPDVLLAAMADSLASCGPAVPDGWHGRFISFCSNLLMRALREAERVVPKPLLSGTELIRCLGLSEGPQIGRILRRIQEAQAEGTVRTRDEALELARRLMEGQSG
ncbi:MAG: HD domain-containing protein [Armatimonadota bacterium]